MRFRYYWRALSQAGRPGRPKIAPELQKLIRRMWRINATWGEIAFCDLADVSRFVLEGIRRCRRPCRPDSDIQSAVRFPRPSARSTEYRARQRDGTCLRIVDSPADCRSVSFRYGDGVVGDRFRRSLTSLGNDEIVTAPASPWQNAYVERVIGSLRREPPDHVIIPNERHLKRLLSSYLDNYRPWRTHQSLDQDAPDCRRERLAKLDQVDEFPVVQGLHHYYLPRAA